MDVASLSRKYRHRTRDWYRTSRIFFPLDDMHSAGKAYKGRSDIDLDLNDIRSTNGHSRANMKYSTSFLALAALVPLATAQSQLWGQCTCQTTGV